MTPAEEDEFTELVDADIPRVDLVDKAANGTSFLIAKSAVGAPGLLEPDLVRDLIGAPEPAPAGPETVTMTGSVAAIAKVIYAAAVRSREAPAPANEPAGEQVAKAKYDADDLRRMAANGQAMDDESYPIADREDLEHAVRAVGRGGAGHDSIRRHIIARAKALGASAEIPDNWNADGSLKVAKMAVTAELDEGTDRLDPTVPLAAPTEDAPGNPAEPGSPAWEAIDAATAQKWTSILARAKTAIDLLAEREMLEAAAADPGDAEQAMDLQDACCAIDYAISVLAPFAVAEQAEADCAADSMAAVGKALAGFDTGPLDTIEALASITKAGRVLSASNEAAIRGAVEQLQKVLTSLPQAPTTDEEGGRPVAKTANEEPDMPQPTPSADVTEASGQEPAMGAAEPAPQPPAGVPVSVEAGLAKGLEPPAAAPVVKADGEKEMVAVYDAKGKLVGIVDPEKITRIAGADTDDDGGKDDAPADDSGDAADAAAQTPDLEPAPPAEVGTPADAVPDDDVAKQTTTPDADNSSAADVAKKLDDYSATQEQVLSEQAGKIAKQEKDLTELAEAVEVLKGQIRVLEEQPAVPGVFTNGAVPPAHQMRGQDRGAQPVDVAKAQELKKQLYRGPDAGEQNAIHGQLNEMAIDALHAIHQGGARQ
ncbi:hypothetical protein [Streptomyces cylindrosporus]|uniref:Uncharacterized protein n=1 Tax=Streptomyces cylindrosporus TaxID=2927583 RepID=A0ABS9YKG0_9ACTN|nr:hypothetical protein [Streptomyces cylindrosporus]MCI3277650.1 hypothetical protein [Streptomyces cylindrosporus]